MSSPLFPHYNEPANLDLLRDYWLAHDAMESAKTQDERQQAQAQVERIKKILVDNLPSVQLTHGSN